MKIKIEKKPSFTVVGIKKTFRNDAVVNRIPDFWRDTPKEIYEKLISFGNSMPKGFIGLCADFDGVNTFDYYIAVATTHPVPEGFVQYKVPAATWAILEQDGELWDLHTRFWQEWLPSSGYRRAKETIPDIEVYPDIGMPEENYNYELWFPIIKD